MSDLLKKYGQPLVYQWIHPLVLWLHRIGVTPNFVTTCGLLVQIAATCVLILGASASRGNLNYLTLFGILVLFSGLFDMIDGRLARIGKMETKFGALYDSVLDRYSECVLFLGICFYLVAQNYFFSSLFAFLAMIGSVMVSYVKARAEGLGIPCNSGLMQRPERVLTLGISAILCGLVHLVTGDIKYFFPGTLVPTFESITIFTFPIFLMAILTNLTAVQRILEAQRNAMQIDQ